MKPSFVGSVIVFAIVFASLALPVAAILALCVRVFRWVVNA